MRQVGAGALRPMQVADLQRSSAVRVEGLGV